MSQALFDKIEAEQARETALEFNVGDTVKVHTRVKEGGKERTQVFQGIVIGRRGRGRGPLLGGQRGFPPLRARAAAPDRAAPRGLGHRAHARGRRARRDRRARGRGLHDHGGAQAARPTQRFRRAWTPPSVDSERARISHFAFHSY